MEVVALINSFAKIAVFVGTAIKEMQAGTKTPEQVAAEWEVIIADINSAFANFKKAGDGS